MIQANEKISDQIDAYVRAANYLTVAQLYLLDNFLLTSKLRKEHVKERSFGHWGNAPAINFIFGHLNALARSSEWNILPVIGTGHSGPAMLANLFLEGTLEEFYLECTQNLKGIGHLARSFASPGGFPTELSSSFPGCIHPGGELGHALNVAFGTVLDSPETLAVCILGDGECETAATATAWHGIKFLSPNKSGAVLPIINLNGYKMSSPSLLSMMSDFEITSYFSGLGYEVRFVTENHLAMMEALEWAVEKIISFQLSKQKMQFPLIILKTQKGWTGPIPLDGSLIVGTTRAHKAPLHPHQNPEDLIVLEEWLRSYSPNEIFDDSGCFSKTIQIIPSVEKRLGKTLKRIRDQQTSLPLPETVPMIKDTNNASPAQYFSEFLTQTLAINSDEQKIRIFSPDELESNQLHSLLKVTTRNNGSSDNRDGRVLEILSEHVCQGWAQGHVLSGKQGWFTSYECFIPVISSALSQYIKYLAEAPDWQGEWPSLNYFLTSLAWQNSYSHQNPDFTQTLIAKFGSKVRLYFPPDARTVWECAKICMQTKKLVNVITAGKTPLPIRTTRSQAEELAKKGVVILDDCAPSEEPDIIIAAAGDYVTHEAAEAIQLLRTYLPDIRLRFISVCEITCLGNAEQFTTSLSPSDFNALFTANTPVIFAFNGYPSTIQSLLFGRPHPSRFQVLGYTDKGTTTSFLGMCIRNGVSRYHIAKSCSELLATKETITLDMKKSVQNQCDLAISKCLANY